jgi:hypothetical protein
VTDTDQTEFFADPGAANRAEPPRGSWGRYLLPYPGKEGGKQYPHQRVTTFAGILDDTYNLAAWGERMTAAGLARRPDLLALAAAVTDPGSEDGKRSLNEVTKAAKDAAGAGVKANLGTALHAYTEPGRDPATVPPQFHADVAAYRNELARNGITELPHFTERVAFNEDFDVAGRFDGIYQLADGSLVVGDKKTGSIEYATMKIAIQLATYAYSRVLRNYETSQWEPMPNVRKDIALVFHLPVGEAKCTIYQVNIIAGYWAARVAAEASQARKTKTWFAPFLPGHTPANLDPKPTAEQLAVAQTPAPAVPVLASVPGAVDPFAELPVQVARAEQPAGAIVSTTPAGTPDNGWMPTPEQIEQAKAMPPVTESRDPGMQAARAGQPAAGNEDVDELAKRPKAELQSILRQLEPGAKLERYRSALAADIIRLRAAGGPPSAPAQSAAVVGASVIPDPVPGYPNATVATATPSASLVAADQAYAVHQAANANPFDDPPAAAAVPAEAHYLRLIADAPDKAALGALWQEATKVHHLVWSDALNQAGIARMKSLAGI